MARTVAKRGSLYYTIVFILGSTDKVILASIVQWT